MNDLIYIAGFFDGEGCVSPTREGVMRLQISQGTTGILEWIQSTLGYGHVRTHAGTGVSAWRSTKQSEILDFVARVGPHTRLKRLQLEWAATAIRLPKDQRQPFFDLINQAKMGNRSTLRKNRLILPSDV